MAKSTNGSKLTPTNWVIMQTWVGSIQQNISRRRSDLLSSNNSPLIIISQPGRIDDFNALAKSHNVGVLPPPMAMARVLRLALALVRVALVVSVDEATEASTVTTNDHNGLVDPTGKVFDILSAWATQGVYDVHKIR